jgi:hypothetical protein
VQQGSAVRGVSNTFETYASELTSLLMKELLVNLLCREDINILLLLLLLLLLPIS